MSYQPVWDGRSGYGGKRRPLALFLRVFLILMAVGVLFYAALAVNMCLHAKDRLVGEPQVMVVFGCQVKPDGPSVLLRDRLGKALSYLEDHPDMTVVVSGGQGKDEPTTEAAAMADYLREHDFEGELLLEETSHNTWQNVRYSLELLTEKGYDITDDVMLVSNGYHLARVEMLWDRARTGLLRDETYNDQYISTLAAPMSHKPSAVYMFFREPIAMVKSFVFDR